MFYKVATGLEQKSLAPNHLNWTNKEAKAERSLLQIYIVYIYIYIETVFDILH